MLLVGSPSTANIKLSAGKVSHSLITGCINTAKIAVALCHRQAVIPGAASLHFVLCLSSRRLERSTRHTLLDSTVMGKGRLNSMVVSFHPPTRKRRKGRWFRRLGLCPEEAFQEPQSTLQKTSPRKGSIHPWGKAVAGSRVASASPPHWSHRPYCVHPKP